MLLKIFYLLQVFGELLMEDINFYWGLSKISCVLQMRSKINCMEAQTRIQFQFTETLYEEVA